MSMTENCPFLPADETRAPVWPAAARFHAFEWLSALATTDGAPEEAGIALDTWHNTAMDLQDVKAGVVPQAIARAAFNSLDKDGFRAFVNDCKKAGFTVEFPICDATPQPLIERHIAAGQQSAGDAHALAGLIASCVGMDERDGGCDVSAGLYGPHMTKLIRDLATRTQPPKPDGALAVMEVSRRDKAGNWSEFEPCDYWRAVKHSGSPDLKFRTRHPSPARTCSDERPCIPCYSDSGDCLGPYRAKPAGAVPLPERPSLPERIHRETLTAQGSWTVQEAAAIRAYGDAREAAWRADAVPAFRERVSEIEDAIAAGKMDVYQCFAQMRQLIVEPAAREAAGRADAVPVVGYRWRNSDHHPWTLGETVSGFDLHSREIGAAIEPLGVVAQQMTTQGEASGTVSGYLPKQRAVEVKLDAGVPEWMTGKDVRVSIIPTGSQP